MEVGNACGRRGLQLTGGPSLVVSLGEVVGKLGWHLVGDGGARVVGPVRGLRTSTSGARGVR